MDLRRVQLVMSSDAQLLGPADTDGLTWIPAQTYTMGSDRHYPEERPARQVTVDGFWMETHQVSNAQFEAFADATGYLTVAERPLDPADFPGAPEVPAAATSETATTVGSHSSGCPAKW